MTVDAGTWWSRHKLACMSLALSVAEILVMGGILVSVLVSKRLPTPHLVRLTDDLWLVGAVGSVGFALAGLVADSDRTVPLLALIVAIAVSLLCGFPIAVSD
jgi:hypothetical protein